jgi:hypothetical protein
MREISKCQTDVFHVGTAASTSQPVVASPSQSSISCLSVNNPVVDYIIITQCFRRIKDFKYLFTKSLSFYLGKSIPDLFTPL